MKNYQVSMSPFKVLGWLSYRVQQSWRGWAEPFVRSERRRGDCEVRAKALGRRGMSDKEKK